MAFEIHIITLNVPYPPDYGGMIDSFFRIKALYRAGVKIHLHCFTYGREHSDILNSLCTSVNYYNRDRSVKSFFSILPYTVVTRNSEKLLENLTKDNHPIFFDGIHTAFLLDHPYLSARKKYVRVHNIEHSYYASLARFERDPLKKVYYSFEALKLRRFERVLACADALFTVSDTDQEYFEDRYHNAEMIPSFHPCDTIESSVGSGEYIIYHGDLSVNENALVAEFLISKIFAQLPYRCIVAGKKPPMRLFTQARAHRNVIIVPDPDNEKMDELIRNAHINILFSIASNGLKLKLLVALFSGRHCLVNNNIIKGTMLGPACTVEDSATGMVDKIKDLMNMPFTLRLKEERTALTEIYTNEYNSRRLIRNIFGE
jgi:glycosyltransferase involved in cell wall biosynthesis